MSVNNTFKPHQQSNTKGTKTPTPDGMTLTVELWAADPADLATNFPRVWINTTAGVMKFTLNGSTIKTVTAT